MARVAIALGSNQGDREQMLRRGILALKQHLSELQISTFHETDPVGVRDQRPFLNAAVTGTTDLCAADLLDKLLEIERNLGRQRPYPGAPRTLDLDLVLYDDLVVEETGLVVPHPRFRDRVFVLAPLAEIARDWKDPVTGRTIGELLANLVSR